MLLLRAVREIYQHLTEMHDPEQSKKGDLMAKIPQQFEELTLLAIISILIQTESIDLLEGSAKKGVQNALKFLLGDDIFQ